MIYRVYTKVSSADEFWDLQKNPEKAVWWHDSECKQIPTVANFREYITGVFCYGGPDDDPPYNCDKYPQLVCAEVCY